MPDILTEPRISKDSIDKLFRIREAMIVERRRFLDYWKLYDARVNPQFEDFEEDQEPGQKAIKTKVDSFDNTGQKASDIFANGLQSAAFGRSVPWIGLSPEDPELDRNRDGREWLQLAGRHLARQFNRTNFYEESRAFTRSAADFGTGILFRESDPVRGMPIYHAQHLKRCLIAENKYGEVDTLFRDFWITPWEAVEMFGNENLSPEIQNAYQEGSARRFMFIQFIFPRDKFDLDLGARDDGKEFYIVFAYDKDRSKAVREGGYDKRPFYAWRWARSLAGDVWGVDSPGMIEYSNLLQLNSMGKDFSRLVQLAARPPIKATEGLREQGVRLEPNARHWLRAGEDFAPVPVAGPLDGIAAVMDQLRQSARASYYADFFMTLTANLERVKTATEATYLKGEQSAMLAAMTGRLAYEFLEPAVEDIFSLELSYARLPPVPDVLKGGSLKIDLVSPLAQLQKRYMMLSETDEFMVRILQVGQQAPEVLDRVNMDKYADVIAEAYNQDQRVIRDMVEVEGMRKARKAQQEAIMAQQLKNETIKANAAAMSAGDKAPEEGSPMAMAMGGGKTA